MAGRREVRKGWFERQCKAVDKEVSEWPEWMRKMAGFDDEPVQMSGMIIRHTKKGYRIIMEFSERIMECGGKTGKFKWKLFVNEQGCWVDKSSEAYYFESERSARVCLQLLEQVGDLEKKLRYIKWKTEDLVAERREG